MQLILAILTLPFTALARAGRWFTTAPAAVQVAAIVAIFQLLIVILAVAVVWTEGDRAILQAWWSPGKGLSLLALLLLVPWLVHRAARLWFEHQGERWPDVAAAWNAAREQLARQQVSLTQTPVFVVLGSDGGSLERGLFAETTLPLLVRQAPEGDGPLHVHANHDAIFVCLSGCGQAALGTPRTEAGLAEAAATVANPMEERHRATDRLAFACDLLRDARRPLAPVNGVLVVTTLPLDRPADSEAIAFGQAVGEDLATLVRLLGVRPPVTFVAASLQDDPAIKDLLARLSPADRAAAAGAAFPTGLTPTPSQLGDLAANVAGSLMDRLVTLLLDPRRIGDQPANRHLLGMLGRLGLIVNRQMALVLTHAFAPGVHGGAGRDGTPLLAGVAVAAVTPSADKRAFVRGLIERVIALQGELAWTARSLAVDAGARRWARAIGVATLAMVVAAATILWWKATR